MMQMREQMIADLLEQREPPVAAHEVPYLDRLVARLAIEGPDGCWMWTGSERVDGYGQMKFRRSVWVAHRVAYTLLVGPIPDGLELDHTCQVKLCCSPHHLEPVTGEENIRRYLASDAYRMREVNRYGKPCSSPTLVADVVMVIASTGQRSVHTVGLLASLAIAHPKVYGDWDAQRLAAELVAAGVKRTARQMKVNGVNRSGYRLDDFLVSPPEVEGR